MTSHHPATDLTIPIPALRSPAAQLADALDLLAALLAAGLLVLTYEGRAGLPRVLLALGFAFFVPGRALVTPWPGMARWSAAAIPMLLSLAVLALAAMTTLWAHYWHPVGLFQAEAWASLAVLAAAGGRRHKSRLAAVARSLWPSPRGTA